jgi:transposase
MRIRQFAARRQKNDRRDAELLLDFLLRGDFPCVHVPSPASQEVLRLLRYRHRLVGIRTMLRNGLRAVMLNNRAAHGSRMRTLRWRQQLEELHLMGVDAIQREHSLGLIDELKTRIAALEIELERRGADDAQVALLQTHLGVGLLTALAVFHTLQPIDRFNRARCVRHIADWIQWNGRAAIPFDLDTYPSKGIDSYDFSWWKRDAARFDRTATKISAGSSINSRSKRTVLSPQSLLHGS